MIRENYLERVSKIDPDNITPETVQLLFPFVPKFVARWMLNTGVRQGEFIRVGDNIALAKKAGR